MIAKTAILQLVEGPKKVKIGHSVYVIFEYGRSHKQKMFVTEIGNKFITISDDKSGNGRYKLKYHVEDGLPADRCLFKRCNRLYNSKTSYERIIREQSAIAIIRKNLWAQEGDLTYEKALKIRSILEEK